MAHVTFNRDHCESRESVLMPGLLLQRKCACGQHAPGGGDCSSCAGEKKLQRQASVHTPVAGIPQTVNSVLSSPGEPLAASTRSFMESRFSEQLTRSVGSVSARVAPSSGIGPAGDRFEQEADQTADQVMRSTPATGAGTDFSGVRIHTDERAGRSAEEIGAVAYTAGTHIVFGRGQFRPETAQGRQLLAHELTHVLQQGGRGSSIQRKVIEKTPCAIQAYDNSNPKDKAIVPTDGSGVGVSSVADLVTRVNAHVDDEKNHCTCIKRLDINGHGADGYQSVGNGSSWINNEKALVHTSTDEHLQQLSKIKFCGYAMFSLIGCHVGRGDGKTLLHRLSTILPGKLVGGAQHFTAPTAGGGAKVQGEGDKLTPEGNIDMSKVDPFLTSRFVRWHLTINGKEYVINGDETTSKENKGKLKAADKVNVKTPDGVVNIK
jgi:Domain of unknown function (DUF4157)